MRQRHVEGAEDRLFVRLKIDVCHKPRQRCNAGRTRGKKFTGLGDRDAIESDVNDSANENRSVTSEGDGEYESEEKAQRRTRSLQSP